MSHRRRGNSSVTNPIGSGDLIGTESGCFSTGDDEGDNNNNNNANARPLIRQRGNAGPQRELPPPLTTSVTRHNPRRSVRNRSNLVRSSSEDGQRLVIQGHERNQDKDFYMKSRRKDGRLTISLVPRENVDDDDDSADDDGDGGGGGDDGCKTSDPAKPPPDHHDRGGSSSSQNMSFPFY